MIADERNRRLCHVLRLPYPGMESKARYLRQRALDRDGCRGHLGGLKHGGTIEDAATHFCRSGTVEDVRRKAEELGC
jgi:hypothetical protein